MLETTTISGKRRLSSPVYLPSNPKHDRNPDKRHSLDAISLVEKTRSPVHDDLESYINVEIIRKQTSDLEIDTEAVEASLVYVNQFQPEMASRSNEIFPLLQIGSSGESQYFEQSFLNLYLKIVLETRGIDNQYVAATNRVDEVLTATTM